MTNKKINITNAYITDMVTNNFNYMNFFYLTTK